MISDSKTNTLYLADIAENNYPKKVLQIRRILEEEGIITVSGNKVTIINKTKLSDMSNL
jgi:predicted methyltransferase